MPERCVVAELKEVQPSGRMCAMRIARTDLPLPFSDAMTSTNVVLAYISKICKYISSCGLQTNVVSTRSGMWGARIVR